MKKKLVVGLMVCTMVIGAFAVYADSYDINELPPERGYGNMMEKSNESNIEIDLNNQETKELRNERQEERTKVALKDDIITQEQANGRRTHFDEMDKFHEEKGFKGEHCHDRTTDGNYGHGMMGGNRY